MNTRREFITLIGGTAIAKGAPVRVMGRQFPPAGGTGATVRSANGCGVPRPRISALRFPHLGVRRVRNRQFGTTARRDAPRGNAPARLNNTRRNDDAPIGEDHHRSAVSSRLL